MGVLRSTKTGCSSYAALFSHCAGPRAGLFLVFQYVAMNAMDAVGPFRSLDVIFWPTLCRSYFRRHALCVRQWCLCQGLHFFGFWFFQKNSPLIQVIRLQILSGRIHGFHWRLCPSHPRPAVSRRGMGKRHTGKLGNLTLDLTAEKSHRNEMEADRMGWKSWGLSRTCAILIAAVRSPKLMSFHLSQNVTNQVWASSVKDSSRKCWYSHGLGSALRENLFPKEFHHISPAVARLGV